MLIMFKGKNFSVELSVDSSYSCFKIHFTAGVYAKVKGELCSAMTVLPCFSRLLAKAVT